MSGPAQCPVRGYGEGVQDEPIDPFAGDPGDPSADLDATDDTGDPLTEAERQDVLEDLADLEIYQALLTPIFLLFSQLSLTNTLLGLAIIHTHIQLPFSMYGMRNSFEAVPRELDEAAVARLDLRKLSYPSRSLWVCPGFVAPRRSRGC